MHVPNDMISIRPIRPDCVDHDLGLGDNGFNRRVIPDIYDQNSDFVTELELSLELFQLLLRPSRDSEREWC